VTKHLCEIPKKQPFYNTRNTYYPVKLELTATKYHSFNLYFTFLGSNLLLIIPICLGLNPKAFSKSSSLIPDPKMAAGIFWDPGFWLLKLPNMVAGLSPTFIWKCTRPLGYTMTSPCSTVLAKTRLVESTKPEYTLPSTTYAISVALGWKCGGFIPPTLRSARMNDMPSVLRPGKTVGFTGMAARPVSAEKFPALFTPEKTKSSVVASDEFLHGRVAR
jgi:hypothetical protein